MKQILILLVWLQAAVSDQQIFLTKKAIDIQNVAKEVALARGHFSLLPVHFLLAGLGGEKSHGFNDVFVSVLSDASKLKKGKETCTSLRNDAVDFLNAEVASQSPPPKDVSNSVDTNSMFVRADAFRQKRKDASVGTIHLLFGLTNDKVVAKILKKQNITASSIEKSITSLLTRKTPEDLESEFTFDVSSIALTFDLIS